MSWATGDRFLGLFALFAGTLDLAVLGLVAWPARDAFGIVALSVVGTACVVLGTLRLLGRVKE